MEAIIFAYEEMLDEQGDPTVNYIKMNLPGEWKSEKKDR